MTKHDLWGIARRWVPQGVAWTALATLALAACSSPAGPTAPLAESGTRLRARFTDAGGGARRFDGWYDSQLGSACTFMIADDGVYRCLVGDTGYSPPVFVDGACSNPVELVPTGASVPAFVAAPPPDLTSLVPITCGDPFGLTSVTSPVQPMVSWRVGAQAPATSALYQWLGGACVSLTSGGEGQPYYVEEVPPSSLVGATRVTIEPRGATLAAAIVEADDGSRWIRQIVDAAMNQPCTPSWSDGVIGDYRCYAATAMIDQVVAPPTANCSAPIFAGSADEIYGGSGGGGGSSGGAGGGGGLSGGVQSYSGCDVAPTFRRLAPTTCTDPLTLPAGCQAFDLGGLFDATEFPALASGMVGTGRVRLVVSHPVDDDRGLAVNPELYGPVGRYTPGPFFDTERQLPCTDNPFGDVAIHPFADGTIRCVTADVIAVDYWYADAACSVPAVQQVVDDTSCPALATGITPKFALSGRGQVYALGSLVERTEVYYLYPSDSATPPVCQAIPLAAGTMFYDLTPADPGMFATLTQVTE